MKKVQGVTPLDTMQDQSVSRVSAQKDGLQKVQHTVCVFHVFSSDNPLMTEPVFEKSHHS